MSKSKSLGFLTTCALLALLILALSGAPAFAAPPNPVDLPPPDDTALGSNSVEIKAVHTDVVNPVFGIFLFATI